MALSSETYDKQSCEFAKKGTKGSRTGSVLEPFLVAAFDKFSTWTVLIIAHMSDALNPIQKKGHSFWT